MGLCWVIKQQNSAWGGWIWWTVGPRRSPLPVVARFIPDPSSRHSWSWPPSSGKEKPLSQLSCFPLSCCPALQLSSTDTPAHTVGGSPRLCPHPCPAPRQGPGSLHLPLPWTGACSSTSELEVGFNKKTKQTVAIKHNVLPNKLLSCLHTWECTLWSSLLILFLYLLLPDLISPFIILPLSIQ